LFVNEELLDEGMATTLSIAPNDRLKTRFAAVEAGAHSARRGLWGSCFDEVAGSVTP
jgi:endonuclease YncB( thermonuclease family)